MIQQIIFESINKQELIINTFVGTKIRLNLMTLLCYHQLAQTPKERKFQTAFLLVQRIKVM